VTIRLSSERGMSIMLQLTAVGAFVTLCIKTAIYVTAQLDRWQQ
jgi:hypothetical protein